MVPIQIYLPVLSVCICWLQSSYCQLAQLAIQIYILIVLPLLIFFYAQGKQWMDRASRFRSSALKVGMKRPGIHQ
jgi:hypothetical protein